MLLVVLSSGVTPFGSVGRALDSQYNKSESNPRIGTILFP